MTLPYMPPRAVASVGTISAFAFIGAIAALSESEVPTWQKAAAILVSLAGVGMEWWRMHKDVKGVGDAFRRGDSKQQVEIDAVKLEQAEQRGEMKALRSMRLEFDSFRLEQAKQQGRVDAILALLEHKS